MSERISGANVRHPAFTAAEWMASPQRNVPQSFLDAMADQTEADAADLERLRRACTVQNDAVCQTLGRVVGYPRYADDQSRFPSATEDDGVCIGDHVAETLAVEVASALERSQMICRRQKATLDSLQGIRALDAQRIEVQRAELARLTPLAAMGEALRRVREHPERDTKIALWFGGADWGSGCFTLDDGRITASTWVELADKLDALAAARVPGPEPEPEPPQEWCVVRMDNPHVVLPVEWGFMSRERVWRAACGHPAYQRRTAARVVRHPDGSFTVIPERGE